MTTRKNVVNVTIQGAEYTLRTETSPEQAVAIAAYVDRVITDMMASGSRIESHKAAILAALQITGELFDARTESDALAAEMADLKDEIRPWLPPAKRKS